MSINDAPSKEAPSTSVDHETTKRYPEIGISILIVGAGVGGLMTALEGWRKGLSVRILERSPSEITTGDSFTIGPSAIRQLRYFPKLWEENEEISYDPWIAYRKHTDELIFGPDPIDWVQSNQNGESKGPLKVYRHSRPKFHKALSKQAERCGMKIEYGKRVVDYFETLSKAGVTLDNGEKIEADVVVAADGINTKSWKLIAGEKIAATSSGFSIYRTAFPVEIALQDPLVRERFTILENGHSVLEMLMGEGMHLATWRSHDTMTWGLTHKDEGNADESWHNTADPEGALKIISQLPGWPEAVQRLIKLTPKDSLIDWKIMWRNPQPQWTSPEGRVIQLGDSAHTFIPSSASGATQAIEDAISLTTCLYIGGKSNIPQATRIHNKLRFDRTSCCQKLGFINQSLRHNTNWSAISHNPSTIQNLFGKTWIFPHNAEKYALENYDRALEHLVSGAPFENTNVPKGYTCKPWGIEEFIEAEREGRSVEVPGDWR